MEEKEEALRKRADELTKMESEKKRKEEEEELEKVQKQREAEEKFKRDRPMYVKEVLEMDLDRASIGSLKHVLKNLGISMVGCVEKQDLKKALIDNVPELRIRTVTEAPQTSE